MPRSRQLALLALCLATAACDDAGKATADAADTSDLTADGDATSDQAIDGDVALPGTSVVYQFLCERIATGADAIGVWDEAVCVDGAAPPVDAPAAVQRLYDNAARLDAAVERLRGGLDPDALSARLESTADWSTQGAPSLRTAVDAWVGFLGSVDTSEDDGALAVARMASREGLLPPEEEDALRDGVLAWERRAELTWALADALAADAALAWRAGLAAWAVTAGTDGPRTGLDASTRALWLASDPALAEGTPLWAIVRDARGLPAPAVDADGNLPAPFVDANADGLADVDPIDRFVDADGAPLAVATPWPVLPNPMADVPRTPDGFAIDADGNPLYARVDLDPTVLAAVVRLAPAWLDEGGVIGLPGAVLSLLGPRAERTVTVAGTDFSASLPSIEDSPVVDAARGVLAMLAHEDTDAVLDLVEPWLAGQEPALTGVIDAFGGATLSHLRSGRATVPGNAMGADGLELVQRMAAEPGLLEAYLTLAADPTFAAVGPMIGEMMRNGALVTFDPANPDGPPLGLDQVVPIDWDAPDGMTNRSQLQRTVMMLDAMRGVRLCNRADAKLPAGPNVTWPLIGAGFAECELLQIDDLAEAWLQAAQGTLVLEFDAQETDAVLNYLGTFGSVDDYLEDQFGIEGFGETPTLAAFNRLLFAALATDGTGSASCDPSAGNCLNPTAALMFAPVVDRHGDPLIERHGGTAFAWERPGLTEGLAPLLGLASTPGFDTIMGTSTGGCAEARCHLLLEWIALAATHYPSPDSPLIQTDAPEQPRYALASDLRLLEPALAEALVERDGLARLGALVTLATATEVAPMVSGFQLLVEWLRLWVDPAAHPTLTTPTGAATTILAGGTRTVPVSPAALLVRASGVHDEVLADDLAAAVAFRTAAAPVLADMVGMTGEPGALVWAEPRAHGVLLALWQHTRRELDVLADAQARDAWAAARNGEVEAWVADPSTAPMLAAFAELLADPVVANEVAGVLAHLLATRPDGVLLQLGAWLMASADASRWPALAATLAHGVAPGLETWLAGSGDLAIDAGIGVATPQMVGAFLFGDDAGVAFTIIDALLTEDASGESPLDVLVAVGVAVNSQRTGVQTDARLQASELQTLAGALGAVLGDLELGAEALHGRLAEAW